jgi:hypothetical protein
MPVLSAIKQALRVRVAAVVHEAVECVDVALLVVDRDPVYSRKCFNPLACSSLQPRCCPCGISRRCSSFYDSFKDCGALSEASQAVHAQLPFHSVDAEAWSALQHLQLVAQLVRHVRKHHSTGSIQTTNATADRAAKALLYRTAHRSAPSSPKEQNVYSFAKFKLSLEAQSTSHASAGLVIALCVPSTTQTTQAPLLQQTTMAAQTSTVSLVVLALLVLASIASAFTIAPAARTAAVSSRYVAALQLQCNV